MSVYHSSFNYLGINSRLKNLIIMHLDPDQGEIDTSLSLDPIYTDSALGVRRFDYGSRFNSVATFRITVVKPDGADFSVAEVRDHLKWLTGTYNNTTLELLVGNTIKAVFVGRFTGAWQYKMDVRTVSLILEFTSISPFAYSPKQTITRSVVGSETFYVHCPSDDLFSMVTPKVTYKNTSGNALSINNFTTEEETTISGLTADETIIIDSPMAVSSDKTGKTFGNTFNLVFPKFKPGINEIQVTGTGDITFEYSYPMKIGNVAVDIEELNNAIDCESNPGDGTYAIEYTSWEHILNRPNTIKGYNITDAYTKTEVDEKIGNVTDELEKAKTELNNKIDATKTELNTKIDNTKADLEDQIAAAKTELNKTIDDAKSELNNTINKTKTDLESTINDVQTELDAKIDSTKKDLQDEINEVNVNLTQNITNLQNSVYTKTEIDNKLENFQIDDAALNAMLVEVLV